MCGHSIFFIPSDENTLEENTELIPYNLILGVCQQRINPNEAVVPVSSQSHGSADLPYRPPPPVVGEEHIRRTAGLAFLEQIERYGRTGGWSIHFVRAELTDPIYRDRLPGAVDRCRRRPQRSGLDHFPQNGLGTPPMEALNTGASSAAASSSCGQPNMIESPKPIAR